MQIGRSGQRMRGPLPVYEQIYNRFCRCGENPEASLKPTDLNSLIESWRVMLESLCGRHGIKIEFRLEAQPIPVMTDTVLMEQVIINIVKNSAESIGSSGLITVATSASPATLTVTDNGPGIDPEAAKTLQSLLLHEGQRPRHRLAFCQRSAPQALMQILTRYRSGRTDTFFNQLSGPQICRSRFQEVNF